MSLYQWAIMLSLGVSICMALSIVSCETCFSEDVLLHLDHFHSSRKELTMKHTFLTQFCIPDDVGEVTAIVYKFSYRLSPDHSESWISTHNHKTGKVNMLKKTSPICVVTWMDLIDGHGKRIGLAEILNQTSSSSIDARGVVCVDIRYFGSLPAFHRIEMVYSGEVWWMGKK